MKAYSATIGEGDLCLPLQSHACRSAQCIQTEEVQNKPPSGQDRNVVPTSGLAGVASSYAKVWPTRAEPVYLAHQFRETREAYLALKDYDPNSLGLA